jgi:hypothetical protein
MSLTSSSDIPTLLKMALEEYERKTGINLEEQPLTDRLSSCDTAESIISVLEEQAQEFKNYRGGNEKGMKSLKQTVHILYTLSGTLGDGFGVVCGNG